MIKQIFCVWCMVQQALCISMDELFPFGMISGDRRLMRSDDGSSSAIQLQTNFPYYDSNQRRIYVNNNGLLSFNTPTRVFTSQTFPIASVRRGSNFQVIAPFWGDVDTSGSDLGTVWYRQTDDTLLSQEVKKQVSLYSFLYPEVNLQKFNPKLLFVATWHQVGYYRLKGDKRNTFQCILVTDGEISFAMFLYPEGGIKWTTGDGSGGAGGVGGTSAQIGFNAGDGIRSLSVPVSQTNEVIDIDELLGNTGRKGFWIFRVDTEIITSGECDSEGAITLLPNKGSLLGGTALTIVGPCFNDISQLICVFKGIFGKVSVAGTTRDDRRALCVIPPIEHVGRLEFQLVLVDKNNITTVKSAPFFSLSAFTSYKVSFADSSLLFQDGSSVTLTWRPEHVFQQKPPHSYDVDITLYALLSKTNNTVEWTKLRTISEGVPNWGTLAMQLPIIELANIEEHMFPITFQVTVSNGSLTGTDSLPLLPGIWTSIAYYSKHEITRSECINWIENSKEREKERLEIQEQPLCPCTLQHAQAPGSGVLDRVTHSQLNFFNPGAYQCGYQLQTINKRSPARRQCCYDSTGYLLPGPPTGGHSALVYPRDGHEQLNTLLKHFKKDIIPFLHCCKANDTLCAEYYKLRPSSIHGQCAVLQNVPGRIFGDPHFITFDALKYTFNGRGEFSLVESEDLHLSIQGRFTEAPTSVRFPVTATILSAVTVRDTDSDTVQVEVSRQGINTLVNGEHLPLEEQQLEIILKNATLIKEANNVLSINFDSGMLISVESENEFLSLTVSLPSQYARKTRGLLGTFDGDVSNDLIPKDFSIPLSTSSPLRTIHEGFGLTWIIGSPSYSLFVYKSFQSFETFFEPSFSSKFDTTFRTQELEIQANELCGEDKLCLFDIAVTERLSVGNATKHIGRLQKQTALLTQPIFCDPPCENGVCSNNNTCKCQLGYEGPTCNRKVMVDRCITNVCSKIGTCQKLGEDTVCVCPPYASGFNCENKFDFEIECSSIISDEVLSAQCNTTFPILSSTCVIDGQISTPCTFPAITVNISSLGIWAGNHSLRITVKSILNEKKSTEIKFEVKPVNLTCDGGIQEDHLLIKNCVTNNKITAMECTINDSPKQDCKLPIMTDLTTKPAGRYILNVTVTDVFKLRDAFVLQYTKPSLRIDFVNSSPRVTSSSMTTDFYVNRLKGTYTVKCYLTGQEAKDCSQGYVKYSTLSSGTYTLRIVASAIDGGRYVLRRRVYIDGDEDSCAVQLINSGVEVEGQRVSIHFVQNRATQYALCKLDGGNYRRCRSPYRLDEVPPGLHRIQVRPVCYKNRKRHGISMKFFAA